jgi:hypothetical protein
MSNHFFVSVHIPKTAGTSLSLILNRVFNYRLLLDYASFDQYNTPDPLIVEHRDFIEQFYTGIHGHFSVMRHLNVFRSAKFISCVRHPVSRIISQYLHELNDSGSASLFHSDIKSGRMSIIEFSMQDGIGNGMAKHLAGLELREYDLLLLTEKFEQSLHALNYVIGDLNFDSHFGDPPVFPVENSHKRRSLLQVFDEDTRREIYLRSPQDVEVYRKAEELFIRKVQRLNL